MKLGKRERILAVLFGAFCVLFSMERLMLTPVLDKTDILDTQIEAQEKKMGRLLSIDLQKEDIAGLFDNIRPYTQIGRTDEDALSVIMKEVEETAKDCRIALVNMKPEMASEKVELGYNTRRLELSIEGSQRNIIKFLYRLENGDYPMSIKRLDFKIKDRNTSLMQADLDVHFIYFL